MMMQLDQQCDSDSSTDREKMGFAVIDLPDFRFNFSWSLEIYIANMF